MAVRYISVSVIGRYPPKVEMSAFHQKLSLGGVSRIWTTAWRHDSGALPCRGNGAGRRQSCI